MYTYWYVCIRISATCCIQVHTSTHGTTESTCTTPRNNIGSTHISQHYTTPPPHTPHYDSPLTPETRDIRLTMTDTGIYQLLVYTSIYHLMINTHSMNPSSSPSLPVIVVPWHTVSAGGVVVSSNLLSQQTLHSWEDKTSSTLVVSWSVTSWSRFPTSWVVASASRATTSWATTSVSCLSTSSEEWHLPEME